MFIRKFKERTIARDLVLSLTLSVIVMVSILMGLFFWWSDSRVAGEVAQEADLITSELVDVLVLPISGDHIEVVEQIVKMYQKKKLVTDIQVTSLVNQIVIITREPDYQGEIVRHQDIVNGDEKIGSVRIVFSDYFYKQERMIVVRIMLFVTFVILLVIIGGTFKFVNNCVQIPLQHLLHGISEIADGHYGKLGDLVPQKDLARILDQVQCLGQQIHQKNNAICEVDARYRAIFDGAVEGLFQLTMQGQFLTVNPAMVRIYGFESAEEMIRTIKNIAKDIFVESGEFYNIVSFAESQGQISGVEFQAYHHDGHKIWVTMSMRINSSESTGDVLDGSMEDITEIRQLEADLHQSQKMEAVGTMAGGIAHDFNNILTAIMGYTELAQIRSTLSDEVAGDLDEIYRATVRAKDLIAQILTFSRRDEIEVLPVVVAPVVEEALQLIFSSLPDTIKIQKEIKGEEVVRIDATKMHQIVMNLCTNAHHAMQDSGGLLKIMLKKVAGDNDVVSLAGLDAQTEGYLLLEISDTGCGMDEADIEKIFEPYFSTKKSGQGTGLGLAVVHAIVEGAGGRIVVYSLPGMGTSFHVFLPIV